MKVSYCVVALLLGTAATAAQAQDGKTLFEANCKKCHGVLGSPPKAIKKKMSKIPTFDAEFLAKVSEDSILKVLNKGGASEDMKPFKDKLSPAEMAAVAKYVRELAARPRSGNPE
jgi:cytochrome c oxidase cbb3-type subunit III